MSLAGFIYIEIADCATNAAAKFKAPTFFRVPAGRGGSLGGKASTHVRTTHYANFELLGQQGAA